LTGVSATLISALLASTVRVRLRSYAPTRRAETVRRVH
jgi:hypothetical protein